MHWHCLSARKVCPHAALPPSLPCAQVMRKVMDKPSFAHAESKRLSKLLNGKLGNEKVMAMQAKLNILTAFMRDSNREEM